MRRVVQLARPGPSNSRSPVANDPAARPRSRTLRSTVAPPRVAGSTSSTFTIVGRPRRSSPSSGGPLPPPASTDDPTGSPCEHPRRAEPRDAGAGQVACSGRSGAGRRRARRGRRGRPGACGRATSARWTRQSPAPTGNACSLLAVALQRDAGAAEHEEDLLLGVLQVEGRRPAPAGDPDPLHAHGDGPSPVSDCQSPQMWPSSRRTTVTSSQCAITHRSCHAPAPPAVARPQRRRHHLLPPCPRLRLAEESAELAEELDRARVRPSHGLDPRRTAPARSAPPPWSDRSPVTRDGCVPASCRFRDDADAPPSADECAYEAARRRSGASSPSSARSSRVRARPGRRRAGPRRASAGRPRGPGTPPPRPRRAARASPWSASRAVGLGLEEHATRSGQVEPKSAARAPRSCSDLKGSCWNSESSQRSSASARVVSPSASASRTSSSAASAARNSSSRVGSPGGCVAAIGSTGRMPKGRPSSVSKSTGPAASGAAVARRIALTASAISAGASGDSSSGAERGAQLEHAVAVGLATEAEREQAARLRPVAGRARRRRRRGRGCRGRARAGCRSSDPTSGATAAYDAALAEQRALQLGVAALERLVVPVEAPAGLRDARREGRRGPCGTARRPRTARAGVCAGIDRGSALAAQLLERDRRVVSAAQTRRRGPRRSRGRAAGTRRARARHARRAPRTRRAAPRRVVELAEQVREGPEGERAERVVELRRANGHAPS